MFQKILARQPILNKKQITLGYELLFRSQKEKDAFPSEVGGEVATLKNVSVLTKETNLTWDALGEAYLNALIWTNKFFSIYS
ncbi:MAG: hypothetical protein LWW94_02150 [Candidatus Desulfofervidaceae bacterium]|nr:hypothetical protein [Candidatus Desulfofervidaceae bacterium]